MKRIDYDAKVGELRKTGLCCAQITLLAGMEIRGEENPQLINAARTLCSGMHRQKVCGAVTGGCLMLCLWDSPQTKQMVKQFGEWFETEFGTMACGELIAKRKEDEKYSCGNLIRGAVNKCQELLIENGLIEE